MYAPSGNSDIIQLNHKHNHFPQNSTPRVPEPVFPGVNSSAEVPPRLVDLHL